MTPQATRAARAAYAARAAQVMRMMCAAWALAACVTFDPDAQPDDDPVTPPRSAEPLAITSYSPGGGTEQGANPAIWWGFNQYLDPSVIGFHDTLSLTSAGVSFTVRAHYEVVDKRVVGRLTRPLEPGLAYVSTIKYENIRSLQGAYMPAQPLVDFRVGLPDPDADALPPSPARVPTWTDDIAPLFAEGCACHTQTLRLDDRPDLSGLTPPGLNPLDVPPLTYDALVQQPSAQRPSLLLVRPLDAPNSYLMHKLLDDYPIRRGAAMPPPWTPTHPGAIPYRPLTRDALRAVELWIRAGAPR